MRNEGFDYRERARRPPPGTTVLTYLAGKYPHSTACEWRERIAAGRVTIDDEPAAPDTPLRDGQVVVWHRPPWVEPDAPACFALLHADEHVWAVAKPAGLPTLPGAGYLCNTLLHLVRLRDAGAVPLHRLGRGTSGVVLFARTDRARTALGAAWRERRVFRRYRALAEGCPESTEFSVEVPIGRVPHPLLGGLHAASPAGRPARSCVRVVEQRADRFLADVILDSGKPHQVRIHLAAAGFPLVGDPLYVAGGVADPGRHALPGDLGYLLHAAELRFPHPATGREIVVTCVPPPPLRG